MYRLIFKPLKLRDIKVYIRLCASERYLEPLSDVFSYLNSLCIIYSINYTLPWVKISAVVT